MTDMDFVIGLIIGFMLGIIAISLNSSNVSISKDALIKNKLAYYSTTNSSFILDLEGGGNGK